MGSGKSSWAIQEMNTHKDRNYLYIAPLLTEVDRIKENTEFAFYDPKQQGEGKLDSFNKLLSYGKNIVSTHSLFKRINDETKKLLIDGKYTLILDEVLDVVAQYKDLTSGDIEFLQKENIITIDKKTGNIIWDESKEGYKDYKYEEAMLLSKNKCLMYINEVALWQFPKEVFSMFDEIYVLTYLFRGSVMKSYFDYHEIQYSFKQVENEKGKYYLAEYRPQDENREKYKGLINICMDNKINTIGKKFNSLSKRWFRRNGQYGYDVLQKNIYNYFTNKIEPPAKANTIMWTTFLKCEPKLQGNGYKRAILKSDMPPNPTPEDEKKAKCFVPLNCKGTNIYSDRFNLVYALNRYIIPQIKQYFFYKGVDFDEEYFSLGDLLQWMWRSRIRNNQQINIYIPSSRMRQLLGDWIQKKI